MKDKWSITKRWEWKIQEMYKKADFKYSVLAQNEEKKANKNLEYALEKIERKKKAYIKKKEEEYKRKMLNEIRVLEWKPKREYKSKPPKLKPIQFAMEIAQENARLRDSDKDWRWRCISCNTMCEWWEHAWWHRHSRRFLNMCLEIENINLQCHTCNYTTWPKWDTVSKEKVNHEYDINLDKKYWEWTADKLKWMVVAYLHGKSTKYDLDLEIPRLIEENEKLWDTKNFYAPKKKWRAVWVKYKNRV